MGSNCLIRTRIAVSLVLLLLQASSVRAQDSDAARCDWLLGHVGDAKTLRLAGKSLFLDAKTAEKITDLQRNMGQLHQPGIVVYSPVVSAGEMVMLRFETQQRGAALLVGVRETQWNTRTFSTALSAAQQNGGDFFRRDLQRRMITEDVQGDVGKTIFVFDPESYGLVPTAFQLENTFVLASPKIDQAIINMNILRSRRVAPSEFVAVLGLPSNEVEYKAVFENSPKFGGLSDWQQHNQDAQAALAGHGVRVIGGGKAMFRTKAELLSSLESQAGIIFLVAHTSGSKIVLPGSGQPIEISPADIASLHFTKKPLVILRVCQGEDHGFANAFVEAGAGAVWANRGVIRADVAIQQIKSFLDGIGPTNNALTAIDDVLKHSQEAKASLALLTELHLLDTGTESDAGNSAEQ